MSTAPSDNVVSALLALHRLTMLLSGGDKEKPLPAAEPGLSAWTPARGGFKRVGACGSSHSHGRTTQGHQARWVPVPRPATTAIQHGQPGYHSQGIASPYSHIHIYSHSKHTPSRLKSLHPVAAMNSGDDGTILEMGRKTRKRETKVRVAKWSLWPLWPSSVWYPNYK